MVKRTVTYENFDGIKITEDVYFNFRKNEILKMELGREGRLTNTLKRIIDAKDVPCLMKEFDQLILSAYGQKSPDGKRFIKSPELAEAFKQSEAYDIIFMQLVTDDDYAAAFIKELIPENMIEEIAKMQEEAEKKKNASNVTALPAGN